MREIECFMLEPTHIFRCSLRRYVSSTTPTGIEGHSYHTASIVLPQNVEMESDCAGIGDDSWPHGDERWPKVCECGYVFTDADEWQHNLDRLYRDARDGSLHLLAQLRREPCGMPIGST